MLKTLAANGIGCPAAGLNLEIVQLSCHYIAEVLLNVMLNINKPNQSKLKHKMSCVFQNLQFDPLKEDNFSTEEDVVGQAELQRQAEQKRKE